MNGKKNEAIFQYPELFYNHFQYHHAVDDHNNRRQSPISLERTWSTKWWPHRIFAFLLAITEINVMKAWIHLFNQEDTGTLSLRKNLAEELINNPYLTEETVHQARKERPAARGIGHNLMALRPFRKFEGTNIVESKTKYPQRKCSICKRKCREYCSCSPGTMRCKHCFPNHLFATESNSKGPN